MIAAPNLVCFSAKPESLLLVNSVLKSLTSLELGSL